MESLGPPHLWSGRQLLSNPSREAVEVTSKANCIWPQKRCKRCTKSCRDSNSYRNRGKRKKQMKLFSSTWEPLGELINQPHEDKAVGPALSLTLGGDGALGMLGTGIGGGMSGCLLAPPAISLLLLPFHRRPSEASRPPSPTVLWACLGKHELIKPGGPIYKEERSLYQPPKETNHMNRKY